MGGQYLAMLDALALGVRHGFDPDHLAAITELTASERGGWRGFVLGVRYAVGHAVMVGALGVAASRADLDAPGWVIGATLVGLGAWAMWRLARGGIYEHDHVHDHRDGPHDHVHDGHPVGRHSHPHRHAVAVGAVHGLGGAPVAVLAAGGGGGAVVAFTVGLLLANGAIGAVAGTTTRLSAVAWAGAIAGTGYGAFLIIAG